MGTFFDNIAITTSRLDLITTTAPAAPSGLTATGVSTAQINTAWTDNSNNENNFELQYDTDIDFGTPTTVYPAADAVTYNITSLTQGTTYYFRIRAVNKIGESAYSNTYTAWTGADVQTNLVAYWDLDEGIGVRYDSKSTNHLTDNNTSPYADDATFGYVASFDNANNEYLSHSDNAELSVSDIDFVIAGWFYLKDKATSQSFAGQYTTSGNQRAWQIAYVVGTDQFEAIFSNDGTSTITLEDTVLGSPSATTWYFIVLWHDATANTVNMQINNGSISSEAWSSGVHNSTADFTIGGINGASSDTQICNFGLWKSGLLTAAQKTWLYNSGNGRTYADIIPSVPSDLLTNLISHWRLDNALTDAHTNGYDLTNNNSVGFADAGIIRNSGEFLQSAKFVGAANSYLSKSDNADLSTGDNDFLVSAWVRKTSTLAESVQLIGKDDGSTEREYILTYSDTQPGFRFTIWDSDENAVGVTAVSLGAATLDTEYFVIAWYDSAAGTINVQIGDKQTNRILPLNAAFTGAVIPSDTTSELGIGGNVDTGNADIQSASFWKGGLLTKAEKLVLYNEGFGLDYPWSGSPFLSNETGVYSFGKGSATDENQTGSHTALASLDISGTRYQVAGFWNEEDKLVIAWREMGEAWTIVESSISVSDDDRHDTVSVGLDTSGYVHVVYGHHNDPLNYAISNAALPSWTGTLTTGQTFTGSNESSVTYPFLFNDPTGKLYVRYRDGAAASGDWYLKSNTAGSSTWAGVTGAGTDGIIVNGKTSTDGVYGPEPKFTDDFNGTGTGEMFFVGQWNKGGTYNEDFFFAAWDGTNWTQSDGTSQTMPVTAANCDTFITIANTLDQGWGGITYDSQSRPHLIYYQEDGSGDLQMKHAVYDSGWTLYAITAIASSSFQTGETFAKGDVIYTFYKDYTQDNLIRRKISGDNDYTSWSDNVLYSESLHDPADTDTTIPFHYDRDYYRSSGIMHLLLQPWWVDLGQKPISIYEWTP
jgi:hypothetical protein